MKRSFLVLVLLVGSGAFGCGDNHSDGSVATGTPDGGGAGASSVLLTFWGDIAPIYNAKCVRCHQAGGIGPFPLDDYDSARRWAAPAAAATREGIMPPFLINHDGGCGNFVDDETLMPIERDKIAAWAASDRLAGTPVTLTEPKIPGIEDGRVLATPTLTPQAQGGLLAESDEYRCYLLDPGLEKDAFITAYEVLPGNPALVHHLIGFLVDPTRKVTEGETNAEVMKALDDMDPDRPGWSCFGAAGARVAIDAIPVSWGPGLGPLVYPTGTGIRMKTTDRLVVQVHYNLADPRVRGQSDTTRLRLRTAETVERRLVFALADGLLEELGTPLPPSLAPGQKSVTYQWTRTLARMGLGNAPFFDLLAFGGHMHERGTRAELRLGKPGDSKSCTAKLDRWDFHWQKMYFYKGTPLRLTPEMEAEFTCEYDTRNDTRPILPGWGTRNEMCMAALMVVLPPGL